jgi:hypothetical protein
MLKLVVRRETARFLKVKNTSGFSDIGFKKLQMALSVG